MTPPLAFQTASRLWRERILSVPEYAVIRNDRLFRASFSGAPILESEFRQVQHLKHSLLQRYRDIPLEDVFPGSPVETGEGEVFCITRHHRIRLPEIDLAMVQRTLESDLTLVHGIGTRTERELKRKGYHTIPDLLSHRRYRGPASRSLQVLREGGPEEICNLVYRWKPASHPHSICTTALYPAERFLLLDLETLGISQRPVILVGLAFLEGGDLTTCQYLVRSMEEELPALLATRMHLSRDRVLVTFNGRAFDIPYLAGRYAMYGEDCTIGNPHYDLLHPARRRWRDSLPDCRLVTLEQRLLAIHRAEDVPSMMVPEFYEAFLTSGNPGPLVPVIEHNCQDLISLARLFGLLREGR